MVSSIRLNKLQQEFPALSEVIKEQDISDSLEIVVKRLDEKVLSSKPHHREWDGSMVGINERTVFFIVTPSQIFSDLLPDYESGSNYAHSETVRRDGETLLEGIYRFSINPDEIQYVIEFFKGYGIYNHYSSPEWGVRIYKLPKDQTMRELLDAEVRRQESMVDAEVNF